MRLYSIIANAQEGEVFANLGSTCGLGEDQAAEGVRALAIPLLERIDERTAHTPGVLDLLDFFGMRRYDRFLNDARIFAHPRIGSEGERILTFLLGDADASAQALVDSAAQALPLERADIARLLPYVAIMVMGAVEYRLREPLANIVARINSNGEDGVAPHNPFGALAGIIRERLEMESDSTDQDAKAKEPAATAKPDETRLSRKTTKMEQDEANAAAHQAIVTQERDISKDDTASTTDDPALAGVEGTSQDHAAHTESAFVRMMHGGEARQAV